MTKKSRQFFFREKIGDTISCRPGLTATLVTPLPKFGRPNITVTYCIHLKENSVPTAVIAGHILAHGRGLVRRAENFGPRSAHVTDVAEARVVSHKHISVLDGFQRHQTQRLQRRTEHHQ